MDAVRRVKLFAPDGKTEIVGRLEAVLCVVRCAYADEAADSNLDPAFEGGSDVEWDTQEAYVDPKSESECVWVDVEGEQWRESVLVRKEIPPLVKA